MNSRPPLACTEMEICASRTIVEDWIPRPRLQLVAPGSRSRPLSVPSAEKLRNETEKPALVGRVQLAEMLLAFGISARVAGLRLETGFVQAEGTAGRPVGTHGQVDFAGVGEIVVRDEHFRSVHGGGSTQHNPLYRLQAGNTG